MRTRGDEGGAEFIEKRSSTLRLKIKINETVYEADVDSEDQESPPKPSYAPSTPGDSVKANRVLIESS